MLRIGGSLGLVLGSLLGFSEVISPPYFPTVPRGHDEDCPRGAAEPVVRRKIFSRTTFRLLPDKHSGLETVVLPSGDQLTIRHEGCEYYVLRFRFTTTRFRQSPAALEAWFRNAAQLLAEAQPGINAPMNIAAAIKALRTYTSRHAKSAAEPLTLNAEIEFGDENMRRFLTIDQVRKLTGNKVAVEVSLAVGPL
ncbi:hypothetical protein [Hymenobacter cellulosilyticus]|uniref:Uncharacterized protein n=1 Tax=Hymenobacter cellulosilyticus TaxID=2932248 RepID=A0A8T9Q2X7_9BACT|nr:hypothetical protein [Hymenobacter cellulosilyticus]UOQ71385.1 hypothetical protein MUN79_22600 [Hymenobacter cellulosilyticus]